jgi:hypothetical protein
MRRDTATWAVRADVVVIANTRHTFSGEPEQTIRASAIEHRSRPPHPAPRTVTIAIRPSHRDEIKELNPRSMQMSTGLSAHCPILLSWPGSTRPSTSFMLRRCKDVDARHKAGHDG